MNRRTLLMGVALAASLSGMLVSVAGIYLENRDLRLPLFALTAGAFLTIVIYAIMTWLNRSPRDNPHFARTAAKQILSVAVDPDKYPLCFCLDATHANGVAVAGLVARTMYIGIKHLRTRLLRRQKEIATETTFTPNDLENHIARFGRIHAVASSLVNRGNLVSQCYLHVLQKMETHADIENVSRMLEMEVIRVAKNLHVTIPRKIHPFSEEEPWRTRIEDLLKKNLLPKLNEIDEVLSKAEVSASVTVRNLEIDWQSDRDALWSRSCRPSEQQVPDVPEIIPSCLVAGDW